MSNYSVVATGDVAAIHQLYGHQSHCIDSGRQQDWAQTFTDGGEFHSPSYPEPVVGFDDLAAFAARFFAAGRRRE